tara:strand:+ start:180 stop:1070 length:891 start_codon:yes stop_codon:yes gene_type:complete
MEKPNCPKCESKKIVKRGSFITKAHGKRQRYFCKDCKKKFIRNDGFYRMRNSANKITLCLDLFYRGVSTRKIQEHLKAFYPHNSDNSNIYRWVIKYSNIIYNYTDKLNLNCSHEIEVDEMEYKRRKNHKKKGIEHNWFIDSIDLETRYMVKSKYVKSRKNKELKKFFNDIKNKTSNISTITTDGFMAYRNVVSKSFGYNLKTNKYNVKHKITNASAGEGFNHKVERMHNSVRQLTQNFRGFHGSVYSANSIMKGYEVYYNFIRKHQALKKCPYELATDIKLKENNKWLELINLGIN